jgi:hypothetical protein
LDREEEAAMHNVEVHVYSPEAREDGVAEFTSQVRPIGYTILQAGELLLCLEPATASDPITVNVRSFAQALLRAKALLS